MYLINQIICSNPEPLRVGLNLKIGTIFKNFISVMTVKFDDLNSQKRNSLIFYVSTFYILFNYRLSFFKRDFFLTDVRSSNL